MLTLPNTHIQIVIPHCPGRDQELSQLMASLEQSDWPIDQWPPLLSYGHVSDAPSTPDRQPINARRALQLGILTAAEWILHLEDDVIVNRHLYRNLCAWINDSESCMLSLYGCVLPFIPCSPNTVRIAAEHGWGAQGLLIYRSVAKQAVHNWNLVPGFADIRLFRLCGALTDIEMHTPSLVQHVGTHGTTDFHQVSDFNLDWVRS